MLRQFVVITLAALIIGSCSTHREWKLAGVPDLKIDNFHNYPGSYKVGKSYQIGKKWYHPEYDDEYSEVGVASWYGPDFHGKKTANGDVFNKQSLTAAHRTLPMPSLVRVVNLKNNKSVILMVNDRGPFARDRIIDVSEHASEVLDFKRSGHTKVRVEYLPYETELLLAHLGLHQNHARMLADLNRMPNQDKNTRRQVNTESEQLLAAKSKAREKKLIDSSESSPVIVSANTPIKKQIYVQLGSYQSKENASNTATKMRPIGNPTIRKAEVNGQVMYKVQLGPYQQLADAQGVVSKARELGSTQALIIGD